MPIYGSESAVLGKDFVDAAAAAKLSLDIYSLSVERLVVQRLRRWNSVMLDIELRATL